MESNNNISNNICSKTNFSSPSPAGEGWGGVRWKLPFLLLLILGTVWIVRNHSSNRTAPYQHDEGLVFGTSWHATYQCDSSLHAAIMEELRRVDASLSMFNPQSTVSRINRNESTETDSLFRIVFTLSQEISKYTDGCFDVTVAPLVNAWGFGYKSGTLPTDAQVDSLRSFIGYQHVHLVGDSLVKDDPRMVIDFSAVAKGFGTDCVASLLNRLGIRNYMVEIGGEIVVHGQSPKGKPWSIGINDATEDSTSTSHRLQEVLHLTDCAMATSGNYRNYRITEDGRKVAHTISPQTGKPAQQDILSSTVIAPTCAMADGFATAFMVMGLDKAKEVLAQHPELQAYFIYADTNGENQVWHSKELIQKLNH